MGLEALVESYAFWRPSLRTLTFEDIPGMAKQGTDDEQEFVFFSPNNLSAKVETFQQAPLAASVEQKGVVPVPNMWSVLDRPKVSKQVASSTNVGVLVPEEDQPANHPCSYKREKQLTA